MKAFDDTITYDLQDIIKYHKIYPHVLFFEPQNQLTYPIVLQKGYKFDSNEYEEKYTKLVDIFMSKYDASNVQYTVPIFALSSMFANFVFAYTTFMR